MSRTEALTHEFVEFIPKSFADGVLYISIPFTTAVHRCCCGCGHKVVTPLSPTDWELTFNGESVSLDPSIGNWSFPCRSHYWIRKGLIRWAEQWSEDQVRAGRSSNAKAKDLYFLERASGESIPAPELRQRRPWWDRVLRLFRRS